MKKSIIPVLFVIIATAITGCKEGKRISTEQIQAIEDSIPRLFPTATLVHTNQNEDYNEINLIITDPIFYNAPQQDQQAAAIRSGIMLIHVLGTDLGISRATLVLTKDKSTNDGIPGDGIQTNMHIDSLMKAGVK